MFGYSRTLTTAFANIRHLLFEAICLTVCWRRMVFDGRVAESCKAVWARGVDGQSSWLAGFAASMVLLPFLFSQAAIAVEIPVTISLVRQADIPAKDSGTISLLEVRSGQLVKAGQIVAVLENDQHQLAVRAAELNLKVAALQASNETPIQTAEAQLKQAASGYRASEVALQISKIEATGDVAVRIATAETRLRQVELERAESARKSFRGSVSETEVDRLRTAVEKGQLEMEQAQTNHKVQQLKPEFEQAQVQQKADEIQQYESLLQQEKKRLVVAKVAEEISSNELQTAKLNLEQRNIRAPFDGVVVEISAEVGEWVESGTKVARIIDLATLQAEGFLQADAGSQQFIGRDVMIRVGSSQFAGVITFVSPEVDPVNQQVRFRAEFSNDNREILPGMKATVFLE